MRNPEAIYSMIDYLQARGDGEKDIAILRWVLELDRSEWERKYDEVSKILDEVIASHNIDMDKCTQALATQDAEIRRLKSEPDHK